MIDQGRDEGPLVWPWALLIGWAVACVAVPWLHLQAVAAVYEAVGVLLIALGLAAVGDRLRRVREAPVAAFAQTRSGVGAWSVRRREQFAVLRARLIGRPRPTVVGPGAAQVRSGASLTATSQVHRDRVDRGTISDRDWLAVLDDRVASLLDRLDVAERRRTSDREEFARRLGIQRDEVRAEIVRETRNGWQFVAWGLLYTFIGAVLGAFA